ncbi:MAG: hypothetical protein ABW189_08680 [Rickettsiales bacterium]
MPLSALEEKGVHALIDDSLVALRVSFSPEMKKTRKVRLDNIQVPAYAEALPPANVSGYVNLRGSRDLADTGEDSFVDPMRFQANGAMRYKGVVLESGLDYTEEAYPRAFRRGDTRLVYDVPKKMLRTTLGDLLYDVRGFQSYVPMAGAGVSRDFSLQPYRVTEPKGRTRFFLKEPSRAEVYVNGALVRTMELASGSYDFSDFPVTGGLNAVTLRLYDPLGRMEEKTLDVANDAGLLVAGLHQYSYQAGIRRDAFGQSDAYDAQKPAFSAYHRYGITENVTIGANAQGDDARDMAGVEAAWGGKAGVVWANLAGSTGDGEDGAAAALTYSYNNAQSRVNDVALTAEYRSAYFYGLTDGETVVNPLSWTFGGRYGMQFSESWSAVASARYGVGRFESTDDFSYSFLVEKALPKGVRVTASLGESESNGFGVFCAVAWTPFLSRHSGFASYDGASDRADLSWNYAADAPVGSFSGSAGVATVGGDPEANGYVSYVHDRGEVSLRHAAYETANEGLRTRTRASFGTALAYADGKLAVSRPIADGFVMVAKHPSLKGLDVGLNPLFADKEGVRYEARADRYGPAVLPNFASYLYGTAQIDARTLPSGVDIGKSNYLVRPAYRGGSLVVVGSDARVVLEGTLTDASGVPVALQAGTLTRKNGEEKLFFTDRNGAFSVDGLTPGRYAMRLHAADDKSIEVTAPDVLGAANIGVVRFPAVLVGEEKAEGE